MYAIKLLSSAVLASVLLSSCATDSLVDQNTKCGHELALMFKLYDYTYSPSAYPKTLGELRQGLDKFPGKGEVSLPKCKCADGKLRDFIYISGFHGGDGPQWAFLFSPSEMGSKVCVVVYLDGTAKVMTPSEAAREMTRSRAFVATKH
jgi:hypothetical protein